MIRKYRIIISHISAEEPKSIRLIKAAEIITFWENETQAKHEAARAASSVLQGISSGNLPRNYAGVHFVVEEA